MKKFFTLIFVIFSFCQIQISAQIRTKITVASDGSGDCTTFAQAFELVRAFMDYKVSINVKNGVYNEKIVIPSWLTNVEIVGEDRDKTIITNAHHANMPIAGTEMKMGTFRTFTLRIDASNVTLKNITVENNAPRLGQAVALHTEGDCIMFVNCRFLGNQDTVYTGRARTRLYFFNCYIEGTTDFIFGASTAWFEACEIHSKADSYITAASTPKDVAFGYIFNNCKLTADEGVTKVYLGRPWRPYAYTLFMNCEMGAHIRPEGWHNWKNVENEKTARYAEYNNYGAGANLKNRVSWSKNMTKQEVAKITLDNVFAINNTWNVKNVVVQN